MTTCENYETKGLDFGRMPYETKRFRETAAPDPDCTAAYGFRIACQYPLSSCNCCNRATGLIAIIRTGMIRRIPPRKVEPSGMVCRLTLSDPKQWTLI